ncbi:MAG: class B sortase [Defluviitaleaceae bacterium]|nr:class B sortase [Defluviitaleaceae bacterium]
MKSNNKSIKKSKKKSNIVLYIAIFAIVGFGAAFAYYAYDYYMWLRDGRIAQESSDAMRDMFSDQMQSINDIVALSVPQTESEDWEESTEPMFFGTSPLDEARAMMNNPDIVAYIYIDGTNINNVVVQGPDNSRYLYVDAFGNSNANGAIFMDYRNNIDFSDPNTVIYGHNMRNGTMFHNLRYYMDRSFLDAHPHIKIITDDNVMIYEVFSVFSTRIDFYYIQVEFGSQEEFGELVDEIIRRSVHNVGITASADDNILVLSTCTNAEIDTRYVVVGRLAQTIEIVR